jgi:hypothetical protein
VADGKRVDRGQREINVELSTAVVGDHAETLERVGIARAWTRRKGKCSSRGNPGAIEQQPHGKRDAQLGDERKYQTGLLWMARGSGVEAVND